MIDGVTIRAALADDAASIHAVHTRAVRTLCAPAYDSAVIEGWLRGRTPDRYLTAVAANRMFVAERDDRVVGFCEIAPGELVALFVDPSVAGAGVGRLLLDRAVSLIGAGVIRLESTLNAVGFYETAGFVRRAAGTIRRNDVDVPIVFMEKPAGSQ